MVDGDNDFARMQGRFKLYGKFHINEDAIRYAVAGKQEQFTATWTVRATYRKDGRVVNFKASSSSVDMVMDLYDPASQTTLLERVAKHIATSLDNLVVEKNLSVVLSVEIANEQRDKFLVHPVLSYSFLNFHEFSAADFLS